MVERLRTKCPMKILEKCSWKSSNLYTATEKYSSLYTFIVVPVINEHHETGIRHVVAIMIQPRVSTIMS